MQTPTPTSHNILPTSLDKAPVGHCSFQQSNPAPCFDKTPASSGIEGMSSVLRKASYAGTNIARRVQVGNDGGSQPPTATMTQQQPKQYRKALAGRQPSHRVTTRPSSLSSPFKAKSPFRTPAPKDASIALRDFLISDDCPFASHVLMQYGSVTITGADVRAAFGEATVTDSAFMKGFTRCFMYDDKVMRPDCYGYRICLDPIVSEILNVEWTCRDKESTVFCEMDLNNALIASLPRVDYKLTKMLFLPVCHNHRWVVYCVNFCHMRIDILDPMDYEATGLDFNEFHNSIPLSTTGSPYISGFICMKYVESYDGEARTLAHSILSDDSADLRAEMLQYPIFHPRNQANNLPEELSRFSVQGVPFHYD
ncbi:hypothetical protein ACP4OV_030357 [Aristida adscensionis]